MLSMITINVLYLKTVLIKKPDPESQCRMQHVHGTFHWGLMQSIQTPQSEADLVSLSVCVTLRTRCHVTDLRENKWQTGY